MVLYRTHQTLWDRQVADMALAVRVGMVAKKQHFESAIDMIENRHTEREPAFSISEDAIRAAPVANPGLDPRDAEGWEAL